MAYKYYNNNPNGYKIPDCVPRAISFATSIPYYDIITMLHFNGMIYNCDDLNVRCYEKLLDRDLKLKHLIGNGDKVSEVANKLKDETLILRIKGHLTMSKKGVIHDIWDCSDEVVTDFWIV